MLPQTAEDPELNVARGLPCCVLVVSYEGFSRLDVLDAYQNSEVKAEHLQQIMLTVTKLYPRSEYAINRGIVTKTAGQPASSLVEIHSNKCTAYFP